MEIRDLTTLADYRACEELQRLTWGRDFREVVPPAIQKITQRIGGVLAGAFSPTGEMVGFVFGITGWENGRPCHWSHMLAVRPAFRDRGIGRQLKEHQRAQLVENGVEIMYWTYDPLVARNAHLNLSRLGATILEYVADMYGSDDDNSLDHVIGTDRFIVVWDLTATAAGRNEPDLPSVHLTNARLSEDGDLVLHAFTARPEASVGIAVPGDIHNLKRQNADLATQWRANTRQAFQYYLDRGYVVAGFQTDADRAFGTYVLTKSGA